MKKNAWLWILGLICVFLCVRLFRFQDTFHFYYDQPLFSIKALEIWRSHHVPLIGPPISFIWDGRQIFQGGIIYLMQLFFLLLGGFDPMRSTLMFIIFASIMMVPLWAGVKKLGGEKAAIISGVFYACFPPIVTGTLELTNPYYQLALTPILIWLLAQYVERRNSLWATLLGLGVGILLQFHYQFVLVIALVASYLILKRSRPTLLHWLAIGAGSIAGFSPLIIFELRNNFYNLRTLLLFIEHWDEFRQQLGGGFPVQYFLSLMLMGFALVSGYIKRHKVIATIVIGVLFVWAIKDFVVSPIQGGILPNWRYQDELKVNQIITSENLTNYNIAMWYDTKSITQRYLLMKQNRDFDFENYRTNKYLFVVYSNDNWLSDGAYELNTFKPSIVRKRWKINEKYNLYLVERL